MFQHTAARRRLASQIASIIRKDCAVSTHSRPKAAGQKGGKVTQVHQTFQHTAARRRLDCFILHKKFKEYVSTHSRPKAAGFAASRQGQGKCRFNTQPPEGGWVLPNAIKRFRHGFNTQPPEGGWPAIVPYSIQQTVSTHSRPKAAGSFLRASFL